MTLNNVVICAYLLCFGLMGIDLWAYGAYSYGYRKQHGKRYKQAEQIGDWVQVPQVK